MPAPAINASHVCKKFRLGEQFDSLRDLLAGCVLRRTLRPTSAPPEFWALDDVSFEVQPGESFGIIGPNGAGKSTMLKILAGIMRPNRGRVDILGRVSALIELGAGFHGDLTGRENIYLNASILGMPRREVQHKFDEIVDFADIRDFLDTPLKRYSSGMHARLGFAIAAHVDPQVLLVDEVLSVGDRVFRARCMDKMRGFLKQGVAVVFVSHDLNAVTAFCGRAMVLDRGETSFCGSAAQAVAHYYGACSHSLLLKGSDQAPVAQIGDVRLRHLDGRAATTVCPGDWLSFEYEVVFDVDLERPSYGFSLIHLDDHQTLFETSSTRLGVSAAPVRTGDRHRVRYEFQMNVPPGEYVVGLHVRDRDSLRYAVDESHKMRVMVHGTRTSGGVVHLDPHVDVTEAAAPGVAAAAYAGAAD